MKFNRIFLEIDLLLVVLIIIGFFLIFFIPSAKAQGGTSSSLPCTMLTHPLYIGQTDVFTGADVTRLQTFLNSSGYLSHMPTGYFGSLTYNAVWNFQAANGISPVGVVGPVTRARIQSISCTTPVSPPILGGVTLRSMTPASGPIGTTVTLDGFGFTSDNTVYFDGMILGHFPTSGSIAIACTTDPACVPGIHQSITFVIPSYIGPYCPPGSQVCPMYATRLIVPAIYAVYVSNANGTSGSINFMVTGSGTGTLSVNGIDGPNSLLVGTAGNWTVRVTAPQNSNLHYSVSWGDQNSAPAAQTAPVSAGIQSSATFSHSYAYPGTFNPVFTVSDDLGHSATASATVAVRSY